MALSYSDTVVVILSDWRDTGAGTTENMKMYIWSKLPLPSCKSFWRRRKKRDDLKWLNYCYLQFMVSMLKNCIMQFLKLKKAFWKSISVVSIFVVLALLVIWVWCHQVVTLPSNWSDESCDPTSQWEASNCEPAFSLVGWLHTLFKSSCLVCTHHSLVNANNKYQDTLRTRSLFVGRLCILSQFRLSQIAPQALALFRSVTNNRCSCKAVCCIAPVPVLCASSEACKWEWRGRHICTKSPTKWFFNLFTHLTFSDLWNKCQWW